MIRLLLLFFLATSCMHENLEADRLDPLPKRWEKFVGSYEIYDPFFDEQYQMQINYITPMDSSDIQNPDSLEIINFANRFDLRVEYFDLFSDPRILHFNIGDYVLDQNSNRCFLFLNTEAATDFFPTFENVNTLFGDTMIISAEINNNIFYKEDDTTFVSISFDHIAIKQ